MTGETMKAWVVVTGDGKKRLEWQDVGSLRPGSDDLLVAVKAAGCNRADQALNAGHFEHVRYDLPAPIAGLEMAGEVVGLGANVRGFAIGDRVFGMTSGSFAEQALIRQQVALRVPGGMSWEAAAAIPVSFMTAYDGIVTNGRIARGDAVLVQGASSAAGIAAIQIAKRFGARMVIGTAGTTEKLQALQSRYGLDVGIDYKRESFADRVLAATGGAGVDVVLDMVGASALAGHLACTALHARWVQVGRMGGSKAEIDLDLLARKRLQLFGVTFRTRGLDEFAAIAHGMARDLLDALATGTVVSPIDRVMPLSAADTALTYMRANTLLGKVVLTNG
jgi:NADPH2:quinone reductase